MEGMAQALNLIGSVKNAYLKQFPTGRWGLFGTATLPDELTVPYTSGFTFGRKCKTWDTRDAAIAELTSYNVKFVTD